MQTMNYKGFKARIMKAPRLIGERVHGLPPGAPIDVLPVDAFEEPLPHWIQGAGNYVVPVDSDWGLWFNFTENNSMNTAVLLSIKGMNPVTGQRTNGFSLERYEDTCPVHGDKFKEGLFCEKCNYRWPNQNYIAYPNTLWWDGFRSSDGKVRQFFFTEDMSKSIPELVIGKEDTIPAFGFAFFRPKVLRSKQRRDYSFSSGGLICPPTLNQKMCLYSTSTSHESINVGIPGNVGIGNNEPRCSYLTQTSSLTIEGSSRRLSKRQSVEVGVGAGAEIAQEIVVDSLKVNDWEDNPSSVMRLYFVFVEQFEEIKSKGIRDLVGEKEGFLSGLSVG